MIVSKGELLIVRQNLNNPTENDIKVKLAFLMALSKLHFDRPLRMVTQL